MGHPADPLASLGMTIQEEHTSSGHSVGWDVLVV